MKRFIKSQILVSMLSAMTMSAWAQTPSTEGQDFWVTFLRTDSYDSDNKPATLALHISSQYNCTVTISNLSLNKSQTINVTANEISDFTLYSGTVREDKNPSQSDKWQCYSYQSEQVLNTAIHVTSTAPISLFASNYKEKSFDAANILPTSALLDDYLIQTYPPSAHADSPQGTHFAIVATEDNTVVDYTLTAQTNGGKTGTQTTPSLSRGQVWYVWTGPNEGNTADLSGTMVKARNGKKIAVFQGCPHTNLPYKMRDRDHVFSQAMPTAYWGTEFGVTASRMHRRDIVAVMAINDGTEVYINDKDGDKVLVHTFNFNSTDPQERKHYWTFEIGDAEAYSTHNSSPYKGKLEEPLVEDSSCFISTSCPAGVHLFMVSNTYDEPTATHSNGSISDPAMLWVSPIEQVIKEINFATFNSSNVHFMNILTMTADTGSVIWKDDTGKDNKISKYFSPLRGNGEYSFARIEIKHGSHKLTGRTGFLAHVYGYGERESYAYSCGSSTVQRSMTFDGQPLIQDSVYPGKFCANEEINMKLNIGNNDYESVVWNFGDGITYTADADASNEEKKKASHVYSAPGWYDLIVSAKYVNACTGTEHNEDMKFSFLVVKADTIPVNPKDSCLSLKQQADIIADKGQAYLDKLVTEGERVILNPDDPCYVDKQLSLVVYNLETEETLPDIVGKNAAEGYDGKWYDHTTDITDTVFNTSGCYHIRHYHIEVLTCLDLSITNNADAQHICPGEALTMIYTQKKGNIEEIDPEGHNAVLKIPGQADQKFTIPDGVAYEEEFVLPVGQITKPGVYAAQIIVKDKHCEQTLPPFPVDFTVNYPSDIFKYKFNNVLAVYNKGYGGNSGYEFTAYQWYRNGKEVDGATESVLYLGQGVTFDEGDEVFVMLTDNSGMTLPSCPQVIDNVPNYNGQSNQAPATKHLENRQIIIRQGDKTYNVYGQRVR